MNISPLRYPGGKTRGCKKINQILHDNFDIKSYDNLVSPFFGGGSFEFFVQNNYKLNLIVNDKFRPLYNFWSSVKSSKEELIEKVNTLFDNGIDKDEFIRLRKYIMEEDNMNQSVHYFILNRCSFSGATLSGGFSKESSVKRFTKSSIARIGKLNLDNFIIFNLNFDVFIMNNLSEKNLMFLDPPYYLEKKSNLYGNNGDLHENFNHQQLFELLNSLTNDWILTYNNCEYIKELYNEYMIIEVNWSYSMNKDIKSSEIVILSKKKIS